MNIARSKEEKMFNLEDVNTGVPVHKEELRTKRQGMVNFFKNAKGYGFIKDGQTQESIFLYAINYQHQ